MKKKILSVILFAIVLFGTIAFTKAPTWQEQYDLGMRYLSEGNYEEALEVAREQVKV